MLSKGVILGLFLCVLASISLTRSDPLNDIRRSVSPTKAKGDKKDVFIMTLPRSGSTFVGNLFRHSTEFVYLFEATRGLGDAHHKDNCATEPEKWEEDYIRSLFDCNFWRAKNYVDNVLSVNKSHDYTWGFIQEHSSAPDVMARCFPGDPTSLSAEKRAQQSVAIKEITMWGNKLKWLYDTLGSDLRIIWLVRDIRGWVSSWLPVVGDSGSQSFYNTWGKSRTDLWAPYDRCRGLQEISPSLLSAKHLENLKDLMKNITAPPHQRMAAWWTVENSLLTYYLSQIPKDNYMLISYEHVSKYPVEITQQLYEFLGKTVVPKDIMQWIFKNTESNDEDGDADRYGTTRDSDKMATVWRERLTADQLNEVEMIGAPLFKFFNYSFAA